MKEELWGKQGKMVGKFEFLIIFTWRIFIDFHTNRLNNIFWPSSPKRMLREKKIEEIMKRNFHFDLWRNDFISGVKGK